MPRSLLDLVAFSHYPCPGLCQVLLLSLTNTVFHVDTLFVSRGAKELGMLFVQGHIQGLRAGDVDLLVDLGCCCSSPSMLLRILIPCVVPGCGAALWVAVKCVWKAKGAIKQHPCVSVPAVSM